MGDGGGGDKDRAKERDEKEDEVRRGSHFHPLTIKSLN